MSPFFENSTMKFSWKYFLLFIISCVVGTFLLLWSNNDKESSVERIEEIKFSNVIDNKKSNVIKNKENLHNACENASNLVRNKFTSERRQYLKRLYLSNYVTTQKDGVFDSPAVRYSLGIPFETRNITPARYKDNLVNVVDAVFVRELEEKIKSNEINEIESFIINSGYSINDLFAGKGITEIFGRVRKELEYNDFQWFDSNNLIDLKSASYFIFQTKYFKENKYVREYIFSNVVHLADYISLLHLAIDYKDADAFKYIYDYASSNIEGFSIDFILVYLNFPKDFESAKFQSLILDILNVDNLNIENSKVSRYLSYWYVGERYKFEDKFVENQLGVTQSEFMEISDSFRNAVLCFSVKQSDYIEYSSAEKAEATRITLELVKKFTMERIDQQENNYRGMDEKFIKEVLSLIINSSDQSSALRNYISYIRNENKIVSADELSFILRSIASLPLANHVVKYMINNGVQPDLITLQSLTLSNNKDALQLIYENGGDLGALDIAGRSLLHYSVANLRSHDVFVFFTQIGLNDSKDKDGMSAIDYIFLQMPSNYTAIKYVSSIRERNLIMTPERVKFINKFRESNRNFYENFFIENRDLIE